MGKAIRKYVKYMSAGVFSAGVRKVNIYDEPKCCVTGEVIPSGSMQFTIENQSICELRGFKYTISYGAAGFVRLLSDVISSRLYGVIGPSVETVRKSADGRSLILGDISDHYATARLSVMNSLPLVKNCRCIACGCDLPVPFAIVGFTQAPKPLCVRCFWQAQHVVMLGNGAFPTFNSFRR